MEAKPFSGNIPYWITRKDEVKKRSWSGGTANQLFLFPRDADFEKKDFTCQISTATVDVEESTFTPFEGFDRVIMTTDNDLVLVHDFNCIMDKKTCRGETMAMTFFRHSPPVQFGRGPEKY